MDTTTNRPPSDQLPNILRIHPHPLLRDRAVPKAQSSSPERFSRVPILRTKDQTARAGAELHESGGKKIRPVEADKACISGLFGINFVNSYQNNEQ
jgi:hypothetical protein